MSNAGFVERSEGLHRRVRAFARGESQESFDSLALELARFQAENIPGFANLVERSGSALDSAATIPAVPSEAFRLTRVAVHPPELDVVRFETSGTSTEAKGVHPMRTTATYRALSTSFGREALMAEDAAVVVALAAEPGEPVPSSLMFMMRQFMEEFDPAFGRHMGLHVDAPYERWLLSSAGVNLVELQRACAFAAQMGRPLLVLATSLALARCLEQLQGRSFLLPEKSVVMHTGGPKKRGGELNLSELRTRAVEQLGLAAGQIVGEYGMTELSSQLYEGTVRGAHLSGPKGVFIPPRWLRVTPVDSITLEPVEPGGIGLARFMDLGNVDSAVCVLTQDLIRERDGGIELLGRSPGAVPRGCSMAVQALLEGAQ
ncbi:MAG: acyl-protein synthetase [Polyangiaceae bacterium]|nr:acyl-protein synthetase [Polyangiaceae bacterium]